MRIIRTVFCVLIFICSTTRLLAQTLPKAALQPGGIAVLALPSAKQKPAVTFNGQKVLITQEQGKYYAIVGLPLSLKVGKHQIEMRSGKETKTIPFTVKAAHYKDQYLTIKNKRKVSPYKSDDTRIYREAEKIKRTLALWTDKPDVPLTFILPVTGRISSTFGLRRYYNGEPRAPHSGVDLAVPKGTPIKLAAAGTVALTGNFFFTGNTVIVNHGQGLFSVYCHLSKILVKPKEMLKQGEILGEVGTTGRSTGPHLHWGVILNEARVDPFLFVREKK